jgi:ERCC4-type nuclease
MNSSKNKITIIRDTREKKNVWDFEPSEFINKTISKGLKTGDYSIEGYESLVSLERKANTGEIYNNLFEKRFKDELNRLHPFKYKALILEFSVKDILSFPINSSIPYRYHSGLKANAGYIMSRLMDIQLKGIPIIFAGLNGKDIALSYLKQVAKLEGLI